MNTILKKCIFLDAWIVSKFEKLSYKIEDWTELSNFGQAKLLIGAFAIGSMLQMSNFWLQFLVIQTDVSGMVSSGLGAIMAGGYIFLANQGEAQSNGRNLSWVTGLMRWDLIAIARIIILMSLLVYGEMHQLTSSLPGFLIEIAQGCFLPAFYLLAVTPRPPEPKGLPAPSRI